MPHSGPDAGQGRDWPHLDPLLREPAALSVDIGHAEPVNRQAGGHSRGCCGRRPEFNTLGWLDDAR
jgi:hypothetical protein